MGFFVKPRRTTGSITGFSGGGPLGFNPPTTPITIPVGGLGGSVPSVSYTPATSTTSTSSGQTTQSQNPLAPSTVPPTGLVTSSYDLGVRTIIAGTKLTPDQTLMLPNSQDITMLEFNLEIQSLSGTVSGQGDFLNVIDHIMLADGNGTPRALILGEMLDLNYLRFSKYSSAPPLASSGTATYPSGFKSSGATWNILIPGLRLPASYGPWQLTVYYSPYGSYGLSGVTGATIRNHIFVHFGNAQGYISRYSYQTLSLDSGSNPLQQQAIPKGKLIAEVFMKGFSSVTDIEELNIQTNNQVIESNLTGNALLSRANFNQNASLPTNSPSGVGASLILWPRTQFAINDSSVFDFLQSQADTVDFMWYYLEPV